MTHGPGRADRSLLLRCGLCAAVLCVAWLPSASAQGEPTDAVLAALDDEDASVREAATGRLMRDAGLGVDALAALAARATSAEQRLRLRRVARHRAVADAGPAYLERAPMAGRQAGLGVGTALVDEWASGVSDRPEIVALRTVPGTPAHAVLRPGDAIVGVNGTAFPPGTSTLTFSELIKSFRPGADVGFTIRRDGRSMLLPVRLIDSVLIGDGVFTLEADGTTRAVPPFSQRLDNVDHAFAAVDAGPTLLPLSE